MFPKLSYGCQTRPARRHRQHRLTQADLALLISAEAPFWVPVLIKRG
jgi:hypothetical protein